MTTPGTDRKTLELHRSVVNRSGRSRWWRRRGSKERGFKYVDARGTEVRDERQLERIRALVIPPAWTHVRISPSPRSKLQAVGIDSSGRIQYKYHAGFALRQQRRKYEKIARFGRLLPALRRATNEHLRAEGLGKDRVLAVVIRLINDLYFRVGSETSVRRYRTYGVTTLRTTHCRIERNDRVVFSFVGKHKVKHRRILVDPELASLLCEIKAMGGVRLFKYLGDDGRPRPVTPRDVNDYIKRVMSPEFSAKDFRTWGGTLLAAVTLAEIGAPESEREAKRNLVRAVRRVAEHLGNTPAVCRSSYIHPTVIDRYCEGRTIEEFRPRRHRSTRSIQPDFEVEEVALLRLLEAA